MRILARDWKRKLRQIAWGLAVLAGLAVVLLVGAAIFFRTHYGKEVVRHQLQQRLSAAIDGEVTIGAVETVRLNQLVVHDLQVRDAQHRPVLTVRSAEIDLSPLSLLSHNVRMTRVILHAPSIVATQGSDGQWNVGKIFKTTAGETAKPGAAAEPWHVRIGALEIDDGKVALMPLASEPITLDHVNLRAGVDWMKDHGKITLPSLTASWLQRGLPLQLALTADLPAPGIYQTRDLHLRLGGLELRAPALTVDRHRDLVSATLVIDADAATLRALGPKPQQDGWLADVHVRGSVAHDPRLGWRGALAGQVGSALVQGSGGLGASGPARLYLRALGVEPSTIWKAAPVGRVDATVIARAQGPAPALTAIVELSGTLGTLRIDTLHATAQLDHGALGGTATFATDRGHGQLEATLVLQPLRIDKLHVVARVTRPSELVRLSSRLRGLGGAFDVEVTASGKPDDLTATGSVVASRLRYQGFRARLLKLSGTARGLPGAPVGEVTVAVLGGSHAGRTLGPIIANAKLTEHGHRIALAVTAAGGPTLPYSLRGTAVVVRAGRTTTIQLGTLDVTARRLVWHASGGSVKLQPRGRIDVEGLRLVSPARQIEPAGALDSRRVTLPGDKLHIHVIDLDLGRVQDSLALGAPELGGIVNIDAHLERVKHQVALEVTASGTGVSWRRGVPALDGSLQATVAGGQFNGTAQVSERKTHASATLELRTAAPQDVLALAAWRATDLDEVQHFQLVLSRMQLETALLFMGRTGPATVTGMVSGGAVVDQHGTLDISLVFENVATRGLRRVDATVKARWDRQRLTLTLSSRLAGAAFLAGTVTLAKGFPDRPGEDLVRALRTAPASGHFAIDGFPLQRLLAVNLVQQPLAGTLTAHATLAGSLAQPTGHFDLRASRAQFGKVVFTELAASGDGDRSGVRLSLTGRQQQGGALTATAMLPRSTLAPIAVQLHAQRFDLSLVQVLANDPRSTLNDVTGRLDADLTVGGTRQAPTAQGRVSLRDGRLFVPGANFGELYGVEVDAALTGDRMLLSRFVAASGKGRVNATGEADLVGLRAERFALDVQSDKMLVQAGSTLAAVDLRAHADGHKTEATWDVSARIASGTIYLPRSSRGQLQTTGSLDDVVFVDNLGAAARQKALTELANRGHELPTLRLKLTTGEILVSGPSVHAWSTADLDLALSREGTAITGTVNLPRGDVMLFDRRYQVTHARVVFDGSVPPEAQLSVRLTHEFRSMTLSIQVTGTTQHPVLQLSGDPARYSDAQLAGFVLGGDPDDPNQTQQPTAEQRAADAAAGLIASVVQSQLADALPIDVLRLEVGDGAASGPSIEVGKWLTSGLLLGYRYRTPTSQLNQNSNEVLLEYRFGRRWMLEGSYGNAGAGDADVLWTKRY